MYEGGRVKNRMTIASTILMQGTFLELQGQGYEVKFKYFVLMIIRNSVNER